MSDASVSPRAGGALALVLAAVLLVGCGGGDGDLDEPASALAAEPLLLEGCRERGGYCGMLTPGGQLTAAAWLDEHRMYLADLEGRIRLLDVRTGELWTVRTGLSMPQGLTVLHGRLYVSDLGNVCRGMREEQERLEAAGLTLIHSCRLESSAGADRFFVGRDSPSDLVWEHLKNHTARVLSYRIDGEGILDDERVILDKIIAIDRDHSPNGMTNDGEYVYVSIGYPRGGFERKVDQLQGMSLRPDLMGTIVRIDSRGRADVYARGFRNVYGISVAPDGTIYGADNDAHDGLQTSGHLEELNAIRAGGFYGFPEYGTNVAPRGENVTEPVAILPGVASTATYANEDGVYVSYLQIGGEFKRIVELFDYETFSPQLVYAEDILTTAILEKDNLLYLITLGGGIHVIDPKPAPVPFGMRLSAGDLDRVRESDPIVRSDYTVYLDESRLIYIRESCTGEEKSFFLHIFPSRMDELPQERQEHGFDNMDFAFDRYGWIEGNLCVALRFLPSYDIEYLVTGQNVLTEVDGRATFVPAWMEQIYFPVRALISDEIGNILSSDPVMRSEYDIYLDDSRIIYIKDHCEEEDHSFFLHVYPVHDDDISEDQREHGFENLDFSFDQYGAMANGRCIALRYLPAWEIDYLTTGQYTLREADGQTVFEDVWREDLSFRE